MEERSCYRQSLNVEEPLLRRMWTGKADNLIFTAGGAMSMAWVWRFWSTGCLWFEGITKGWHLKQLVTGMWSLSFLTVINKKLICSQICFWEFAIISSSINNFVPLLPLWALPSHLALLCSLRSTGLCFRTVECIMFCQQLILLLSRSQNWKP